MPQPVPSQLVRDLEAALSPPRFATYVRAAGGDRDRAMDLYWWNTQVAAALYTPLQFAEIAVRNAAVEAIAAEFGPNWHRHPGFQSSLRPRVGRMQMRGHLQDVARRHASAGAAVAEMKFAFWQNLYVAAQDAVLWNKHLQTAFPAIPAGTSVQAGRGWIHDHIQTVRNLRNRIAHHELILSRNLAADLAAATKLVEWRRPSVAAWVRSIETVTGLLARRP